MDNHSTLNDIRRLKKSEYFLLAVLCFVNIINFMDRVGIAAVLVIIEKYFSIGNDLGGLLHTGLLIAYTISAPFHGYCGDRYNRKIIIILCIALWAISTVLGAFSGKYWSLLLSRFIVGIGQSGITTIAPTLISDIAVHGARTVFLSFFYLGIPLGAGLGYVAVGSVTHWLNNWMYGLCVGPIFCVIGIILLIFIKFPQRGQMETNEIGVKSIKSTSYKEDIIYLLKIPSFVLVTFGFTFITFYVGALSWWAPKILYHGFKLIDNVEENIDIESVAFNFGLITILTGIFGVILGMLLSTFLRQCFSRADPLICCISLILAIPFVLAALSLIAISRIITYILIFFSEINVHLTWALVTDMLLSTVVPMRRTSGQGLSMILSHTFGDCISPYLVGLFSEYLKKNYQFGNGTIFFKEEMESNPKEFYSLQMSLFIASFILIFGSLCFFLTSFFIKADKQKALESIRDEVSVD